MMILQIPLDWNSIQPLFQALQQQELDTTNVEGWLKHWSDLEAQIYEAFSRAYRAKMEDTTNQKAEALFLDLLETVLPGGVVR